MTLNHSVAGVQGTVLMPSPALALADPGLVAHLCVFINQDATSSRAVTVTGGVERVEAAPLDDYAGGAVAETSEPDSAYAGTLTFGFTPTNKNVIAASVDLGGAGAFQGAASSGGFTASNTWAIPPGFDPGDLCVVAFGANQSIAWGAVPSGWQVVVDFENAGTFAPRMRLLSRYLQAGDVSVTQATASAANAVAVGGVWRIDPPSQPAPGLPAGVTRYWADNPHAVAVNAVLTPQTGPSVVLDVAGGSVVWDAGDTWRTSATLSVPYTDDTWQLVNEYTASRVQVDILCVLPTGAAVLVPLSCPLYVRRAAVTRPEDRIELALASAASLVDDLPLQADYTAPNTTTAAAIQDLITDALPFAVFDVQDAGQPAAATETKAGDSRWATIERLADAAGIEVWQNTGGAFTIRTQPLQLASGADSLLVGSAGNIIDSFSDWDRDTFANGYSVRATWINSNSQTDTAYGAAFDLNPASPTRWDGPAGKRMRTDREGEPLSDAECARIARSRLTRQLGHGRGVRVTVPIRPWLFPGDPISVELPYGGVRMQTVQRVAHDLASLTTVIDTRQLPDTAPTAYIYPGPTFQPLPVEDTP